MPLSRTLPRQALGR
ncbi:hypothetical protein E2C01_063361 [Portunus trituberculatus]|uniref:Uncharacterized protein n=1 Tax=Portunus trituberculatus TaxID=210409 RepID=A0A5B7HGV0_PORTR|nr:hypothetical protein [Portunus trituberculatus]